MNILCFTGSRAEYYILRPLLKKLSSYKGIDLELIVSGGITKEGDGKTLNDIENDGIKILDVIDIPNVFDNHTKVIGFLCIELDKLISKTNPDLSIVYADRYESFAFAIAATHLNKIILHIEAGDVTEGGTYDDFIRHCITKMSHLFCTSTKKGIYNVMRLGEEEWRIMHSGLLSYEDMISITPKDRENIKNEFKIKDNIPIVLATFHPITLDFEKTKEETNAFFNALKNFSNKYEVYIFITSPNSDHGNEFITTKIKHVLSEMKNTLFIESLGGYRYQTLMSFASSRKVIVCGNSSSIIKEAPFYKAHSLNIGTRQMGRESASTQLNCEANEEIIFKKLQIIISSEISDCRNPYFVKESSNKVINFILDIFKKNTKERILNKKWNFKIN